MRKLFLALAFVVGLAVIASPGASAPQPYQVIKAAMGTNSIVIGYNGTYCAAGCTATAVPANYAQFAPQAFIGLEYDSTTLMPGNVICYDNATLGSTSGNILYQSGPLGSGQIVTKPLGGDVITTGINCVLSTTLSGTNVLKVWFN